MSVAPASRSSWTWLAAIALVALATTTANCGGSTPSTPADTATPAPAPAARPETAAAPADNPDAPAAAALVRNRLAGGGASHAREDLHRRLGRDGRTPDDPRGGHLQSHVLFRGQGRAAGGDLRVREALRGRAEQEAQDGQHQDQRHLRAAAAGPPGAGPHGRQGGSRPGAGHDQAGTAGARELHQPHPHQRQRGRRDGPWRLRDCLGRRPVREGRLRPHGQQVLREPGRAEREAEGQWQGARRHPGNPGQPRRRRRARDGQRGPHPDHGGRRLPGGFLEEDLHEPHRPRHGGPPYRREPRGARAKGQPETRSRAQRIPGEERPRDGVRQHDGEAVSREHEVREASHLRSRAEEVPGPGRVLQEVQRPIPVGLPVDGGAGIPGVAARPEREEPGRRRSA